MCYHDGQTVKWPPDIALSWAQGIIEAAGYNVQTTDNTWTLTPR